MNIKNLKNTFMNLSIFTMVIFSLNTNVFANESFLYAN